VNHFFLDASAWIKRFHDEPGTDVVDHLVDMLLTSPQRIAISALGLTEVAAALNRHRNDARLPVTVLEQAIERLLVEASTMDVLPVNEAVVLGSLPYIIQHNINASDALYLHQLLLLRELLDLIDHHIVLVASDRRLLRAATAEGIATLDPEISDRADIEQLLG